MNGVDHGCQPSKGKNIHFQCFLLKTLKTLLLCITSPACNTLGNYKLPQVERVQYLLALL